MLYFTRPPCEQKKGKTMTTHNMAEAKTSRARMINKRVLPDIFFVPTQLLVTHAKGRNHSLYPDFCPRWKIYLNVVTKHCSLLQICLTWGSGSLWTPNPLCTLAQTSCREIDQKSVFDQLMKHQTTFSIFRLHSLLSNFKAEPSQKIPHFVLSC